MPFDSLENLIREKVREAEQSPVPKSEWDRNAAFLRVQNQLRHKEERSKRRLYYRIAATLLLGILSSLFVYKLKFSNSPTSEIPAKVYTVAPSPISPKSSDGKRPGAVEDKTIERQPLEGPLAKAASPQKQPTQREAARQVLKAKVSAIDKPDSVATTALAVVPSPSNEPAAVPGAPSPERAQLPKAPAESIEIVVVLGGKTLARTASAGEGEAVALGTEEEPRRKSIKKALKKGRTKSIAINRVKNPLSLNTEI